MTTLREKPVRTPCLRPARAPLPSRGTSPARRRYRKVSKNFKTKMPPTKPYPSLVSVWQFKPGLLLLEPTDVIYESKDADVDIILHVESPIIMINSLE